MSGGGGLVVGISCRVSTEAQSKEDRRSLPEQERACRDHAAREGWTVSERHIVRAVVSGYKPVLERPDLDGQMAAMEAGEIDVVLFDDPDRLTRNQLVLGTILDRVERLEKARGKIGPRLRFVTGDFEQSATGRFVLGARIFAAELQRERTRDGSQRGKRAKAAAGLPLGIAPAPYGLAYGDGKRRYVPHPAKVHHVRWMFDEADRGTSERRIALGLEARGALPPFHGRPDKRSPTGRNESTRWAACTVSRILRNPNYVGVGDAFRQTVEQRPGRQESKRGKTVRVAVRRADDDPKVIPMPEGVYPVVIDLAQFRRVQGRLAANRHESQRRDRDPEVGVFRRNHAVCAGCGRNLVVKPSPRGGPYYTCNSGGRWHCPAPAAMQAAALDAAVWPHVRAVLERPELIAERVARIEAEDTTGPELATIDARLADVDRRLGNLRRRLQNEDDEDLAALVAEDVKKLLADRRTGEAARATVLDRRTANNADRERLRSALDYTARVREEIGELDWDGKRQALKRLGVRVVLQRAAASPRWVLSLAWHDSERGHVREGVFAVDSSRAAPGSFGRDTATAGMPDTDVRVGVRGNLFHTY